MNKIINQGRAIVKAATNVVTGLSSPVEKLREARLSICEQCPLYVRTSLRNYCGSTKAVNANGDVVSVKDTVPEGFKQGCGCTLNNKESHLPEKTTVVGMYNTCPANRWDSVEEQAFLFKRPSDYQGKPTEYTSRNNIKVELRNINAKDLLDLGFTTMNSFDFTLHINSKPLKVKFLAETTEVSYGTLHNFKSNFTVSQIEEFLTELKK